MQEMNMLDYIDWRGDLSMIISPFNEVDNLILSEIAYANFDNIVEGLESEETITLQEAGEKYNALERGQGFLGCYSNRYYCAELIISLSSVSISFANSFESLF